MYKKKKKYIWYKLINIYLNSNEKTTLTNSIYIAFQITINYNKIILI